MEPERNGVQHSSAATKFWDNPYSNHRATRRPPPTDHAVREGVITLLRESALPSTELLGRLRRTMVLKESQFTAVREDLREEGIIENRGNQHRHVWVLTDGSTPTPEKSEPATPPVQTRSVKAAKAGGEERTMLEMIGRQTLEIERLHRQLEHKSGIPFAPG